MGDFNWNGLFTRWMPGKKLFAYYGQSTTEDSQKKPARLVGKSYRKAGLPAEVIQAIEGIKKKTYRLHENAQRLSRPLRSAVPKIRGARSRLVRERSRTFPTCIRFAHSAGPSAII